MRACYQAGYTVGNWSLHLLRDLNQARLSNPSKLGSWSEHPLTPCLWVTGSWALSPGPPAGPRGKHLGQDTVVLALAGGLARVYGLATAALATKPQCK